MKEKSNLIKEKSYQFAIEIVHLYKEMIKRNEYVISKQIVRSGTSIGANVEEAIAANSRNDFIFKMTISSKEARETNYWLRLLRDTKLLEDIDLNNLLKESEEIVKITAAIVKTSKAV